MSISFKIPIGELSFASLDPLECVILANSNNGHESLRKDDDDEEEFEMDEDEMKIFNFNSDYANCLLSSQLPKIFTVKNPF